MLERLGDLRRRLTPATRRARVTALAAVAAAIALVSAGLVLTAGPPGTQITAYFTEAIGVYPGSTVRVLGVPAGTIDSIAPDGTRVKVTMTVDGNVPVPARADAVVIAASVISDRYVQLIPAYTSGPRIASGAVIPVSSTVVPAEIDQLYQSLEKLSSELGPNGVNKHGALSGVINTGAANLAGNGADLNTMITQLGRATRTLSGSRDNFFATINNLQRFTTMLTDNNSQVRLAQQQLAQVFTFLAGDRTELAGALNELATALGQVKYFISSNRSLIKSNVSKLASITRILVTERASLAEALDDAPLAVDNLLGAYDPTTHTLDGRGDLLELEPNASPARSAGDATGTARAAAGAGAGAGAGGTLVPVSPRQQAALPPLPLPAAGTVYGSVGTVRERR